MVPLYYCISTITTIQKGPRKDQLVVCWSFPFPWSLLYDCISINTTIQRDHGSRPPACQFWVLYWSFCWWPVSNDTDTVIPLTKRHQRDGQKTPQLKCWWSGGPSLVSLSYCISIITNRLPTEGPTEGPAEGPTDPKLKCWWSGGASLVPLYCCVSTIVLIQ